MRRVALLFDALTRAMRATRWGGYSGYFADPEGYLWEVAHNPLFWVGPKDEDA